MILEELAGKSARLHQVFEEAGSELDFDKVKALTGSTAEKIAEVHKMNRELDFLGSERDGVAEILKASENATKLMKESSTPTHGFRFPGGAPKDGAEIKSIGQMFRESPVFKDYKGGQGPTGLMEIDLKAVFRTAAGWDPEEIRIPRVELSPQRPISVVSHIPLLNTTQAAIKYMEETTFTNAAAETAESTATTAADLIPEAALVLTERTQAVEWLPVFIPVTMQQMEDVEGIEDYVNQRLTYMLQARLDLQIIQGTGVSPLILGTNSKGGINTQAKGADPTPDAIYKAMTKVRASGFAEPSVMFIHPNDWQDIRLLRTADGIYIFGNPMDPGPDRIWGMPVVATTAALENTATLGDYRNFAALYNRRGIQLMVSDSHAHYFTRGMLAIRADVRAAMVHFRPLAFSTVTGI